LLVDSMAHASAARHRCRSIRERIWCDRAQWHCLTRNADTAWAHAGPTLLQRGDALFTYESRIVAYRRGDSTVYRPFGSLTRARSVLTAMDSASSTGEVIGFCNAINKALGFHAWANRDPDAGDSLGVWWSRPPENTQWRKP
jgi:hypothetical protein